MKQIITFVTTVFKFSNIKKGWKTTYLGILIILCALASVFLVPSMTWTEAILAITLGLGLLGVNDPKEPQQ